MTAASPILTLYVAAAAVAITFAHNRLRRILRRPIAEDELQSVVGDWPAPHAEFSEHGRSTNSNRERNNVHL